MQDFFSSGVLADIILVVALRAVLTGSRWPVVMLFLLAALIAHLIDVYRRWLCQSGGAIDGKAR